jgi:tetratricopeptide (TPR) repeat protein
LALRSRDTLKEDFIDIERISGDVIGVGIDGSGNIIGKDISIVINQSKSYGLELLSSNRFKDYKSTEQDLEDWKKGFSFKLEAIKEKREFRRSIVDKIISKLESEHRLLIVGEGGTSKSTILMEIICEYFDKGYKILYTEGNSEIKNGIDLVKFIQDLLKGDNKVLVAVDDVHTERTAAIFYVMDNLANYKLSKNVMFILTARIPEFNRFTEERLEKVQEESYKESIKKFRSNPDFRFELPFYTKDEIVEFIKIYATNYDNLINSEIIKYLKKAKDIPSYNYEIFFEYLANFIYQDTRGHPLLVKFAVVGEGLEKDVENRYYNYLKDSVNPQQADPMKMKVVLVCSMFDIAGLHITDSLLDKIGLLGQAFDLDRALLYSESNGKKEGHWRTIHPKWDVALLSYLYKTEDKRKLFNNRKYIQDAVDAIFNTIKNESITASIIEAMYDTGARGSIPMTIIEDVFEIPGYLSDDGKVFLYGVVMPRTYFQLKLYDDVIIKCDKALEINSQNTTALNFKGLAFQGFYKYEEAIVYHDKAIQINAHDFFGWASKGLALSYLQRYEESLENLDKALEINPKFPWILQWKAIALANLNKLNEAIEYSDKALELDPNNVETWVFKIKALIKLNKFTEAIEYSDKALELDPNNSEAWVFKARALIKLNKFTEANECSDKALELDPNNAQAWVLKGGALMALSKFTEAIEYSDKALELDPNNSEAWTLKFGALLYSERFGEAADAYNKAVKLDPDVAVRWGRFIEGSKAIDPNSANTWYNRGLDLEKIGKYEEAIQSYDKALELDPNNDLYINNRNIVLKKLGKTEKKSGWKRFLGR